jgi:endonuclease-3
MDEYARLKTMANEVYQKLLAAFGLPVWRTPLSAVDELISTILSQNTNDHNRDIAFNRLCEALPAWEKVRDAPLTQVIDAIRPAGLANQKGARIQQVLREITEERGDLNLDFLKVLPHDEVYAWLVKFKGVGPKTASIVMQFALGMPAFPVDTHIHRVSGRIGLRPDGMNAEQAHSHLAGLFQPEQYGPAHLNLIRLGRELCHPRKPECLRCPVKDVCQYYAATGS